MVLKPFENSVLDGLCSKDQLDLLDSIDRLRSQGIDHYVSLPQIIVCGDQSSGKSSVLEAISGVSFPVRGNLCTRFPTELILRKTANVGVSVSIVPHHSHSESERASLRNFHETLDDFNTLPDLIEKAKTAMAIGSFGRAFSKNLLRIEVSGPDRPHLTIVDLPGLIHSETKQQSAADVELVQDVVRSYMKERRSIILAVVSAKNDYANQVVLKLARAADKTGTRTLGVITKPDTLIPGSDSEAMYISLAQNLDVEFRLGWHVLKNMDSELEAGSRSVSDRDNDESRFFSEGIWAKLQKSILGIALLRERLSKLLLAQIAAELRSLIGEIELKSATCRTQLEKLGQPRASIEEQRRYLLTLSQTSQSLIKSAVDGTYNDPFFGDAKTDAGYQKRIRAVVQNLNQSFAKTIASEGHYYTITNSLSNFHSEIPHSNAITLTRAEFLDRIEDLLKRTRGRELPGTFSPMIISDLFLEQSQPWKALVQSHIEKVASAVRTFFKHLISHNADTSTGGALYRTLVEPILEQILMDLRSKTADLLTPHQLGHPITYNHYFTETVQKVRKERREVEYTRVIQNFFNIESLQPPGSHQCRVMDYRPLLEALTACNEPNMNQNACSEALDCMQAYYKVALKRFIDDVAIEAVETRIISKLGGILSPVRVTYLSDDVVTSVAGELEESRAKRIQLTNQLDVLFRGSETCKIFMSKRLQGMQDTMVLQERSRTSSLAFSLVSARSSSLQLVNDDNLEKVEATTSELHNNPVEEPELIEASDEPIEKSAISEGALTEPLHCRWGETKAVIKKGKKGKKQKKGIWTACSPSKVLSPTRLEPDEITEYDM